MTVAGCALFGSHAAVMWADTELNCRPGPGMNKLAVNSSARLAITGAGDVAVGSAATLAAMEARDLDAAIRAVGHAMRSKCDRLVQDRRRDPRQVAGSPHVLAGWCPLAGRVLAYDVGSHTCFRPVLTARWGVPHVPELDALREDDGPQGVLHVALAQLAALRRDCPEAQGGLLTLAVIGAGGVMCAPLADLVTGAFLWTGSPQAAPIPELAVA